MEKTKKLLSLFKINIISTFLIFSVFMIVSVTSILFLLGFKIISSHFLIILIVTSYLIYIFFKKYYNKKVLNASIVISLIIVMFSIFIGGKFYDFSWDGNTYHKHSIGLMKDGLNPVYNTEVGDLWTMHYPKTAETFAAVVYSFTDDIETGKAIYYILIISLLLYTYHYLSFKTNKKLQPFLLSILFTLTPIVLPQIFTYYIDGLISLTLYATIISGITFLDKSYTIPNISKLIFFSSAVTLCVNLKFTAVLINGLFVFVLYIYYIITERRNEKFLINFKKYTLYLVALYIFAICLVGSSTYPKNLLLYGHPFYPLAGEDKIDMTVGNEPASFNDMNHISKFLYSSFSNTTLSYDENLYIKIPFTFTKSEIAALEYSDIRIGGNGIFFGGLIIISIPIILLFLINMIRKKNYYYLLVTGLLAGIILPIPFLPVVWQARYFPQIYLLVLIPLFLLVLHKSKGKLLTIITYIYIILLFGNIIFYTQGIVINYRKSKITDMQLLAIKEKSYTDNLIISSTKYKFSGNIYNLIDKGIKYKYSKEELKEAGTMYYNWKFIFEDDKIDEGVEK